MKKLIILILLLTSIIETNAQLVKYRADYVSMKLTNPYTNDFNEWGEWEDSDVLIVVDANNQVIDIYSGYKQQYNFISAISKRSTVDGNSVHFDALDEENIVCNIEIKKFYTGATHLYIRWSNLQIVYQMKIQ